MSFHAVLIPPINAMVVSGPTGMLSSERCSMQSTSSTDNVPSKTDGAAEPARRCAGVYADLDFRALKPMDDLFRGAGQKAVLGRLSDDHMWQQNIPNAWLASSPGHPFWMFCLMEIAKGSTWLQCKGQDCTRSDLHSCMPSAS